MPDHVFYELSETQAHFLRMVRDAGIVSSIPQRTAAVLLRLGLLEDARRFSSGDTMQAGGFVLTDEGRAWLYVANEAHKPADVERVARAVVVGIREFYFGYLSPNIPFELLDKARKDETTDTALSAVRERLEGYAAVANGVDSSAEGGA